MFVNEPKSQILLSTPIYVNCCTEKIITNVDNIQDIYENIYKFKELILNTFSFNIIRALLTYSHICNTLSKKKTITTPIKIK